MEPSTPALAHVPSAAAPPRGCTNLRLHQLVRRVDRFYDGELAATGLRTTQYSLLTHVLRLGPIAPGQLARAMKMEPSTLSRNLRPLLLAGWIELGPGPDARSRRVRVTPAGLQRQGEAHLHWKRAQQRLNRALGEARVSELHALLDDCLGRLASPGSGSPSGECE